MSGFRNVMKEGWNPKGKDGKKESWRGDFKGINQVAGWMGKGKDPNAEQTEHVSQPLSSLKDPASFGPPPKHINYHGAAALPNETTPDRRGLGAPLSQTQIQQQNVHQQQAVETVQEEFEKPKPPPVPYRVNTTGLSTNTLPSPPVRRLDSPSSASASLASKPKPQLPPRLPPRTDSPASNSPSPPPAYSATAATPPLPSASQGYINQEATSRLASAGVSVPALGIGEANASSRASAGIHGTDVNELQSRFSQMGTGVKSASAAPSPPVQTASGYTGYAGVGDPLPPPLTFRQRHADKIDAGKERLGGMTSRINTFVEDRKFSAAANKRIPRPPGPNSPVARSPAQPSPPLETQAQRKKPPPPPPKREDMRAPPANASPVASASSTPPPVPLNTKPR
ncbi:hypothetical protein N7462_006130 [Penicillium macrosclerotiorum]|uniref:uncharacterized protein n=1 Tax=Penicillium macrosclerotiorum TaxID=303699 RepID=UPI00254868CE|nr:uncharacterized protein N7462_006130 [Penicillium macrosclerotiorum]KAJ5682965.1 hypothetical protein N7462_006130 [Penicillium macrosclerotiorum]